VKILVRERIADAGIDFLRRRFEVDVDFDSPLEEKIADYDAIIVRSATDVSAELIDRAERLKVIGRAGVGVDNVDVEAASRRGIVVANAPQSTIVSAAEHAFGLLLALSRNIPQAHAALKEGRWERARFAGLELADKTLGVVGFGRIGQQVARRARAFEMDVLGHDPYVAPERFRDFGATMVESLEELLAESDFVTLHLSLTEETRGLIDRTRLDGARDGIRIVNAARGELVDEGALAEALRSGKVAGAALDVFSEEPYTGPLLELDNVIVTPHLGASTQEAQDRAGIIVAEQVAAALDGHLVTNAVNMPAVAAEDMEQLGPYLPLAAKLGALAVELAGGNPTRLDFQYFGQLAERDTRLLTVAALNGIFKDRVDQPVNYVNAPLVARERGVEVREESSTASQDFTSLIAVTAFAAGEPHAVAGTVSGRGQLPRLVAALGYDLEVELDRLMLFAENDDRPGMIGALGRIVGEAGVNIANMAVSRNRREARALMALSVDNPVSDELLDRLRSEQGFVSARFIRLPE
jgi:D-3-phosphoglycerate dehydrogenase / 2-oxoglutarate reductase